MTTPPVHPEPDEDPVEQEVYDAEHGIGPRPVHPKGERCGGSGLIPSKLLPAQIGTKEHPYPPRRCPGCPDCQRESWTIYVCPDCGLARARAAENRAEEAAEGFREIEAAAKEGHTPGYIMGIAQARLAELEERDHE